MRWRKLGRVFCPEHHYPWMMSHAANPVAEPLHDTFVRVYFTVRDAENRSSITWLELDLQRPIQVLRLAERPLVSPGPAGSYDDSGAAMGWLTIVDGRRYLYYLGWNLGVTVPWRNSIGLAIAEPGGLEFRKVSRAPLLDRSDADPYSISYPSILIEGKKWRMWYGSNLAWGKDPADMAHVIKYAESDDGIHWRREGHIAVPLKGAGEYALSKPCVLKDGRLYRMWYAHRGHAYRIGYAESQDGLSWSRMDDRVGLDVSSSGWDSQSVEYAYVFDHGTDRFMLYNGDAYGKTGFGIAVLEEDRV
jgi:hypothetical protein